MILLDTHVVLWHASSPAKLSAAARRLVERERAAGGLALASATLMELAMLLARGRVRVTGTPESWLRDLVAGGGLHVREITVEIATMAAHLGSHFPSDPFDRLIAATAAVEGLTLVTADERIRSSGVVPTVW